MPPPGSWLGLVGRRAECEALQELLAAARSGRSQVLVLRGEPGIGKTALLDFLVERAAGFRVTRAAGVESEMELPFAGLHQLCAPLLDRLGALPAPQQQALGTAFGLRPGPPPDRFLVGLAVLTLLSEVAGDRPLVCAVDDAQWLDQASAQALGFVARRLAADPVVLVLAARDGAAAPPFPGLPSRTLPGLRSADAAVLLEAAVTGALDPRVRDRIVAESLGNPLALLELPRGLTPAELAFGGDGDAAATLQHRLELTFRHRLQALPAPSRQLLLVAAAEPVGDVPLLWRAAGRLGLGPDAVSAAEAAGLVELRERVRFRHPLVRSTVYRSATPDERRVAHRALAEATDAPLDPDRRAWHRAHAAVGPDESVAAELEHSAGRALSSGGLAAAAALLGWSAALTPDPAQRVRRSLDAAGACTAAGAFDDATRALATARVGPLGEADLARLELLCAQLSFAQDRGGEALPLLLAAARRLEPVDADLARATYLDALTAALFAGRLASGPGARQVATAVRAAPPASAPGRGDALLAGLAVLSTDGYAPAVQPLRRAVAAFAGADLTMDEALGSAWLAAAAAASLWDDAEWDLLTRRHLQLAREAGALAALPLALDTRTVVHLFTGDLAAAAQLVQECRWTTEVTGSGLVRYGEVGLLAVRGRADEAEPVIRRCLDDVVARGEGVGVDLAQWARAVLCNGLGRYAEALPAAQEAAADPLELGPPKWALAELVEAGVRSGETAAAAAASEQLSALAQASGSDWALGVAASRAALLREGAAADELHREAVDRLGRTGVRVELARAQLLHGEWLRREGRRVEARAQLRAAHRALSEMGLEAFADRARHELLATGETVRRRTAPAPATLTAQEAHIARLAAQGLTNPEIGAALFVSPRTVEWHLHKTFTKLGVRTRRELRGSLPALRADAP
ncbi:HTH-type transcriptional regulator [Modestobacter italicus]|uniref:HTH-type transcriptional regulator n=1 Tax=Modestobacter italicus (strain DSM 44449 / CECT 9708 / BC 501) TaxID=2732864 RepID=I4EWT3_MODI5|nr:LuxR family transcriptional regulator [Modestobacter marinus]CCH87846.1 HTH-type transcriptional regulator [Modestobacter marinus]